MPSGLEKQLSTAVKYGCEDDTYQLLDDIDVNTPLAPNGSTALHIACLHGNPNMVVVLLLNGANPFLENKMRKTPLRIAIENGGDGMDPEYTECAHLLRIAMRHPDISMEDLQDILFPSTDLRF
jgi:ankyrin repeat protein